MYFECVALAIHLKHLIFIFCLLLYQNTLENLGRENIQIQNKKMNGDRRREGRQDY